MLSNRSLLLLATISVLALAPAGLAQHRASPGWPGLWGPARDGVAAAMPSAPRGVKQMWRRPVSGGYSEVAARRARRGDGQGGVGREHAAQLSEQRAGPREPRRVRQVLYHHAKPPGLSGVSGVRADTGVTVWQIDSPGQIYVRNLEEIVAIDVK
jgi:hypothetical protein